VDCISQHRVQAKEIVKAKELKLNAAVFISYHFIIKFLIKVKSMCCLC
jgi:hypothetical protein